MSAEMNSTKQKLVPGATQVADVRSDHMGQSLTQSRLARTGNSSPPRNQLQPLPRRPALQPLNRINQQPERKSKDLAKMEVISMSFSSSLDNRESHWFPFHSADNTTPLKPFNLDDAWKNSTWDPDSDDSDDSEATVTPQSYAADLHNRAILYYGRFWSVDDLSNLLREIGTINLAGQFPWSLQDCLSHLKKLDEEEVYTFNAAGTKMAPSYASNLTAKDSDGVSEVRTTPIGPHLGTIKVGHQYICECSIRRLFAEKRLDAAREANHRLQGIQIIESTREALLLPVKTFNTACTFYHRFRLEHPTPDYNYTEAALASLFVACKVEDTLKKSREVLCAHHNLKNPDHQTTQDDKIFDQTSKVIIGIERLMIEAIDFDFRVRYPQKILAKLIKRVLGNTADISQFFPVAFEMCIDLYKTYAPLKHNSYTCAFVVAYLTAMITNRFTHEFGRLDVRDWHTDEQCTAEVMLDLLDLYTQNGKATKVGPKFDLQAFIDIQIQINGHVEQKGLKRYLHQCSECLSTLPPPTPATDSPGTLSTPSAAGTSTFKRGPKGAEGGSTRFIFDANEAIEEKRTYDEYAKDVWEEWEEEVEEPIADRREDRREPRGPRGPRGHGRGRGRGGFDAGWTPGNRHDRRRRGGGGGGGGFY
ncbi:hypothetical protein M426DRAFT_20917 [Hypoxylon sp. CI-4A]|nr:hypothetical protein M426DRAFT_20917 [Hypoxylon sp. CI-4A]